MSTRSRPLSRSLSLVYQRCTQRRNGGDLCTASVPRAPAIAPTPHSEEVNPHQRIPPPILVVVLTVVVMWCHAQWGVGARADSTRQWPIIGFVLRGFDPPATDYGAGHRGVDIAARSGDTVVAAASGTVTFAGPVAGRGVVTISTTDGYLITVEPVQATVSPGTAVAAGDGIGTLSTGTHCPESCAHVSVRRAASAASADDADANSPSYVDPFAVLGELPRPVIVWSRLDVQELR